LPLQSFPQATSQKLVLSCNVNLCL
jgi:hypothetical protein